FRLRPAATPFSGVMAKFWELTVMRKRMSHRQRVQGILSGVFAFSREHPRNLAEPRPKRPTTLAECGAEIPTGLGAELACRISTFFYEADSTMASQKLKSGQRTTVTYDCEGRLVRWQDPKDTVTYDPGEYPKQRQNGIHRRFFKVFIFNLQSEELEPEV